MTMIPVRARPHNPLPGAAAPFGEPTTLRTRYSLIYVAGYLVLTGLGLGLAPQQTLAMMGSTADYGPTMPRWVGMFSLALGALIVQALRHRLLVLYPLGFFMPAAMLLGFLALYVQSGDPLFLGVAAVVLVGVVASGACLLLDRRHGPT